MEAPMERSSDRLQQGPAHAGGVSRRGFIKTACISAAGAAVLEGCRPTVKKTPVPSQTTRDGPDRSRLATSVQPRELTTKHVHAKRPTCVAIIPPPPTDPPTPPTMAVTSDDDGRLMRWAIGGGKAVSNFTSSTRHQGKAAYVAALGNLALTAGYDATVLLHNLATGHTRTKDIFKKSKPEVW